MLGNDGYRTGLIVLLVSVLVLTAAVLARVLATLFFAITIAYVLYPIRRQLVGHGVPRRIASGGLTHGASASVVVVLAPIMNVIYRRRGEIIELLRTLPDSVALQFGEFTYTVEMAVVETAARDALTAFAVGLAQSSPILAMKAILFAMVVYALLLAPQASRRVLARLIPTRYHGIVNALHIRIRNTLYAIYGLQTMMGIIAFVVAFVFFTVLGYDVAFSLAVIAGLLQFLPIIGPMLLIGAIGGFELVIGNPSQGIAVLVGGGLIFWLGLDTLLRPQLASRTAKLPGSLYLIGFIGGLLTLGPIGFVAGPLVIAILVEVIELLAADSPEQIGLEEFILSD